MGKTVMLGAALGLTIGALAIGAQAQAQQPGAPYPQPGMRMPPLPQPPMQAPMQGGGRWGSQVGGRWWGGANAPGGWAAYRAPYRGYRLPTYWAAPRFYVTDWNRYGFSPPPQGYYWTRYYDDAVLIDGRGQVYDSRHGVDWNGADGNGSGDERREQGNGLAGAAVGAVVGGVAGNVIAGRGNRLAGTLIGAGVGGAAGYAIGHERDGYRAPPPPPYGAGYDDRGDGHGYRREERMDRRYDDRGPAQGYAPSTWVSENGATTVTVTTAGGGGPMIQLPPAAYGYGYGYGGSVTTVTVQSQPVVTTTTTEIVDDRIVYARPVHRTYVRRRVVVCPPVRHWSPKPRWHPKPRVMGS